MRFQPYSLLCLSLAALPIFLTANESGTQPNVNAEGVYTPASRPVWTLPDEDAKKHQAVVEKLAKALAQAEPNSRKLVVGYVTPADLEPHPDEHARIDRVMKDIQTYFREEMAFNGFGPMSFDLELDDQGRVVLHHAKSEKRLDEFDKPAAGQETRRLLEPILREKGIDPNQNHLMIFCQMPDGISPYYGGGTHARGTCWACDLAHQDPLRFTDETRLPNGRTVGEDNTVYIGGTAHELGHCFGLPHTRERPGLKKTRGTSLMGSGNYTYREELRGKGLGSFLAESDAIRLASHPLFTRKDFQVQERQTSHLSNLEAQWAEGNLILKGNVTAHPEAYAVIAYNDPAGGNDYDATTFTAVPDEAGNFEIVIQKHRRGPHQLRLTVCHVNGSASIHHWNYQADDQGVPDLESLNMMWALRPVFEALNQNSQAVEGLLQEIEAAHPQASWLKTWKPALLELAHPPKRLSPHEIAEETTSIPLSNTQAQRAKTGYGPALVNRVLGENGQVLIIHQGKPRVHGLYAHAPASSVYELGGKWKRFHGQVGLQDGYSGSVNFVIRSGDKELFRSAEVREAQTLSFDVDVTGLNSLELLVEEGKDGNSRDWGIWIEPTLER